MTGGKRRRKVHGLAVGVVAEGALNGFPATTTLEKPTGQDKTMSTISDGLPPFWVYRRPCASPPGPLIGTLAGGPRWPTVSLAPHDLMQKP